MRDLYELKREREEKWKREGRPEPRGVARVVEKDFDLDEMMRYVIFQLDPPLDGDEIHLVHYGAIDNVEFAPLPLSDEREQRLLRSCANSLGYRLID